MSGYTQASLATLIGSRICHDLISPIGAINNGLELLTMSGKAMGPEFDLIGESVDHASARIRFFRIAFGSAGDQMVGPPEVLSILRDLYETGRLTFDWEPVEPVQRAAVRMAFLAIMCAETAMPYGGAIRIVREGDAWALSGQADRINVDPELWAVLGGQEPQGLLPPSQVHFALLPLLALDEGRRVRCQADNTTLRLTF